MKKILLILLVLCACLLAGCEKAQESTSESLTAEVKEEIAAVWNIKYGTPLVWEEDNGYPARYYGTYGDCVVLFQGTPMQTIETKHIAGYEFSHTTQFILDVYHEGELLPLSDAYSKGYVTEEQVAEIHQRHKNYKPSPKTESE